MKIVAHAKGFVRRHQTGITVGLTATACFALHRYQNKELNAFLSEHNLLETYYGGVD